ncbi:hypothetical protein FACS1894190_02920 [Spirochaetia bacterium]|nr:hypothetical protein FACS1894190_02920 [Spirochaetia bacterium]
MKKNIIGKGSFFNAICKYIDSPLSPLDVFLICGLLGVLFFILNYGTAVINPFYVDWINEAWYDLPQGYLTWDFFRVSPWHFPIGLTDNLTYPLKSSVVFGDTVPILALIFKLFLHGANFQFQYFGLHYLISYFLQGALSGLILFKLCKNSIYSIIGSVFFTLSPILAFRVFYHTSLTSHYIVLLCIYVCLIKNNQTSFIKKTIIWASILALAALTHLYFMPMVAIIMFFYFLDDFLETKNIIKPVISLVSSMAVLFFVMFLLGYFSLKSTAASFGLGEYSTNLNSLFNPNTTPYPRMSKFFAGFNLATTGQYEGAAYIGLGLIAALLIIIISKSILLYDKVKPLVIPKQNITVSTLLYFTKSDNSRRHIIYIAALFCLMAFALSPTVTFERYKLFTYPIPKFVGALWSTFRGTGRMVWPIMYSLMFLIIYQILKTYKSILGTMLLSLILIFQYADLRPFLNQKAEKLKTKIAWQSQLKNPVWDILADKYKHIFFIEPMEDSSFESYARLYAYGYLAVRHKVTVNDFYVSRKDSDAIENLRQNEKLNIRNSKSSEDTIYVFKTKGEADLYKLRLNLYVVDKQIIGLKNNEPLLARFKSPKS